MALTVPGGRRWYCLLVGAVLLLPTAVRGARVVSGDEPHYLLLAATLVRDFDLDLTNNYASVHAGGGDAGAAFQGQALDHQTTWFRDGRRVHWWQVFEYEPGRWQRDADGNPVPTLRSNQTPERRPAAEYSIHGLGMAVMTAPLLYFFRGSGAFEQAAVWLSAAAMLAAFMLFFDIAMEHLQSVRRSLLVTGVVFFATPLLAYATSFYTEPYVVLSLVGYYHALFVSRRPTLAGAWIAAAVLLKPTWILAAIPAGIFFLTDKNYRHLFRFVTPVACVCVVIGAIQYKMFGAPWRTSQPWYAGDIGVNAVKLLFDRTHGLFFFVPFLLPLAFYGRDYWRRDRRQATVVLAMVVPQFLLLAAWRFWDGGACYGPRLLTPVVPFLAMPLLVVGRPQSRTARLVFAVLMVGIVTACAINVMGAFEYPKFWGRHPLLDRDWGG